MWKTVYMHKYLTLVVNTDKNNIKKKLPRTFTIERRNNSDVLKLVFPVISNHDIDFRLWVIIN